ncbi:MAG: carbohydrate ABC transporter permease [Metamycoplasmataceae bacterium]
MFELKLRSQKKFLNFRLRKNRDRTGQQVREISTLSIVTSVFLKLLLLVFFSMIVLLPFFFMLFVAVMPKSQSDLLKSQFSFFPKEWVWRNFPDAIKGATSSYWTSFFLTSANVILSIVLKVFVTMLAGYAFSIKTWRGKEFLWSLFISLLVLPEVALLTGQYKMVLFLDEIKIRQNFAGTVLTIALPFIASIFNALMYRNAFEAIPNRIKEVAMVDGAVGAKYLFKIAMPMVTPTTLTIVILTALASWNSYLWPALIAGTDYKIISVWLFDVGKDPNDDKRVDQSLKMAGAICAVLPMLLFYFLFRKRIMNAISRQGSTIKG